MTLLMMVITERLMKHTTVISEDSEKYDNGTLAVSIVFAVEMLIFFDI